MGFGGFFALLGEAAAESALWGLTSARLGSVPLALAALLVVGPGVALAARTIADGLRRGVLDASANMLFALGSQRGLVSVVAVVGSLYPVVTVALAGALLDERLSRLQAAGAVARPRRGGADRRRLSRAGTDDPAGRPAGLG